MYTTYYLGAGASAGAIPVVNQMGDHLTYLEKFYVELHYTEYRANITPSTPKDSVKMTEYREKIENFKKNDRFLLTLQHVRDNLGAYQSIDTYARKLQFAPEKIADWDFGIDEMKFIMTIIFCFLESSEYKYYIYEKNKEIERENTRIIQDDLKKKLIEANSRIDRRYTGLLASIIKDSHNIHENVRFISWNYDVQLEKVLQLFSGLSSLHAVNEKFRIFPNNSVISNPKVVKLNGTAGFFGAALGETVDYDCTCAMARNHISAWYNGNIKDEIGLYFAWDLSPTKDEQKKKICEKILQNAKEIMRNTQTLIICGYSFPVYNSRIDAELLRDFLGEEYRNYILHPGLGEETLGRKVEDVEAAFFSKKIVLGGRDESSLKKQEETIKRLLGIIKNDSNYLQFQHVKIEQQFPVDVNTLTI